MAIFTGGQSVAIDSPRHLTLRHARKAVALANSKQNALLKPSSLVALSAEAPKEPPDPQDEDKTPPLESGQAQLHSYWAPGLEAGRKYEVSISQDIKAREGEKTLRLPSKQEFSVDAPRFVLPEGSVYSTYPPQGYPDDRRILPHIVLTDPHLPWERIGSPSADKETDKRNKVPWLALFTFTHDELLLQPGALGATQFKQGPTQSIKMKVGDLVKIDNVATPIENNPDAVVKDSVGEFIFVKPDLIKSFFSTFDKDNKRQVPNMPDVDQYKYLSHVKKINTKGMAIAGHEDFGIFSVVISNRCGPLNNATAANVSVHLVSIEGIEGMSWPGTGKDYVGLCSLHSWTYTVLPPGQLNVREAFEHLGDELDVLRPSESVFKPLMTSSEKVTARLGTRIKDGYSLVKYRVQTGEQTVALYRGPFTPTRVATNDQFDQCSNSGQDFQILDKQVGLMDISYSVAWQIGRTLALGDRAFVASLSRLRSVIRKRAMKDSKIKAVIKTAPSDNGYRSKKDVLCSLQDTIGRLQQIQNPTPPDSDGDGDGDNEFSPGGAKKRWYRPQLSKKQYPKLGFASKLVQDEYLEKAIEAVKELSMGKDKKMYDETNDPVSTDWMVVLSWVVDRMFLDRVPAHYLISDPSHLPPEALRFFYIDPNWVDAMVDGALSLANHMGQDMDRAAIKWGINRFLKHTPEQQTHRPQVPTYGFYLRSDLVTMYPDLRVTTKGDDTGRAPLLRHEIVTDGVMLGLLDCIPGTDLKKLIFTQPPHQQRFAAGSYLGGDKLKLSIRKQYTVDQKWHKDENHDALKVFPMLPSSDNNWFVWSTVPKPLVNGEDKGDPDAGLRILRTPHFAETQVQIVYDGMGNFTNDKGESQKFFDDKTANSALLAMQLNDPYYDLIISLENEEKSGKDKPGDMKPHAALFSLQAESPQPSQELRDLRLVAASTVPRVPDSDDEEDDEPVGAIQHSLVQAASASPEIVSDWGRDASYEARSHTLRNDTAPHVRSLFTEHLDDAMNSATPHGVLFTPSPENQAREAPLPQFSMMMASDQSSSDTVRPAGPPVYKCSVYSLQKDWIVQDKDNLEQDLVFSVLVHNNKLSSYYLIEFDIAIELGPEEDSQYIMETYTGPGARMLSNLRFNVLTSFTTMPRTGNKCLLLRLVPRSSQGSILIEHVQEMSFMLTLAKLNKFKDTHRFVFYTSAYYTAGHEKYPINDDFEVALEGRGV
ncbi:hypothetical protein FSPOR_10391 [Fusarium sporotrichioides]|uniref:Uncharacterized protein n=1 Tax=Fusarium sporotrichioides TaxID=5514 RepID=A0A395RL86_FUSSP|nr:hypothetical protein FSPOR_10391 [Fusarium sporotrichioides]